MPISCAATDRSGKRLGRYQLSKTPRSCGRAAASTAWACSALRLAVPDWHPHPPATPARNRTCTTGVRSLSRTSGITRCTTSIDQNHAQHTIRPPRAGEQHNGPTYHFSITSLQHNEHSYHTWHNGHSHAEASTTGVPESRFAASPSRKGMPTALPRVPNGLPFSRRKRAADHLQKTHDLAREAVGCNGVLAGPTVDS